MNLRLSTGLGYAFMGACLAVQGCSSDCPNCPGQPASLVISPGSPSVLPSRTVQLRAEVLDAQGRLLANQGPVTWQSLDQGFATVTTVSDTAFVLGVGVGSARITASAAGLIDTGTVAVVTTSTFSQQVYPILKASCGLGGCHVTPGPGPVLNDGTVLGSAVYTAVTGAVYLTAGDTTVGRLLGRMKSVGGGPMPPQGQLSTLQQGNYDLIALWIAQGALNN